MKKLLALLLAIVMVLSLFAACGSNDDDDDEDEDKKESASDEKKDDEKEEEEEEEEEKKPSKKDAEKAVADYVEENKAVLIPQFEESFSNSAGADCTVSVTAEGCGIVIDILIDGWDDVPAATKKQLQDTYDSMADLYESLLEMVQKELPELESITYNICEEDGDLVAYIFSGEK